MCHKGKVGEITYIFHKYLFEHEHNTWPTQNPVFVGLKVGEITYLFHKYLFEHEHNTWPTQNPVFVGLKVEGRGDNLHFS